MFPNPGWTPATILNQPGLKIGHFNIRSLPKHLDEFRILIQDNPFDVMCLLETWLNSKWSDLELLIDGYNIIRSDQRGSQSRAETAIYHSSKRMARQRTNINFDLDIEAFWLEITPKNRSTP